MSLNDKSMNIITRKQYADKVDSWIGKEQVIVLTGQRRVGKSYVLKDFINRHSVEPDANIVYIDKEKKNFKFLTDNNALDDYLDGLLVNGKHNYVLIDEVQDIDRWEESVRSLRTEERTDVIITGSNSKMFSSELGTKLAGRYTEINVQSLSYTEFLEFHQLEDSDDSLSLYLNYGGMPGLRVIGLGDDEQVWEYLKGVFNTVMLKDIIERHNIRNIPFLYNLISFLADTTGKINSATSIAKFMKSQQQEVSTNVIISYSDYFAEAYLMDKVNRYDIHGKKLFESNQKIYFGDIGLRNFIAGGSRENDIEKVIENVVYQHLKRLGYKVTVGVLRAGEIDFVCQRPNQQKYVQVAYIISDEETRKREFGRLQDIKDNHPKYVISATPLVKSNDYEGIKHLGLREFLKTGL